MVSSGKFIRAKHSATLGTFHGPNIGDRDNSSEQF
jgi:hypothetical protein